MSSGEMSLTELLTFCSDLGFPGIDLTAYYFPGYPEVPQDQFLYELKRKATRLGLHISGTGVRNDFTVSDESKREADLAMVKNWIVAAAKIGAPIVRIFTGATPVPSSDWKEVAERTIPYIQQSVDFGAEHGVIVAIQNHNDFIQNAEQVDYLMKAIPSDWFGLILDIGSYADNDPYEEVRHNIGHAVSWQIKEKVNSKGTEEPVDLSRLFQIIGESDYHGYLPIETLGPGNAHEKVTTFSKSVQQAMKANGMT